MTLAEALGVFDEVLTSDEYPDQPGPARCCGVSVVMESVDGVTRIYCQVCGRTVRELARQWVISAWGSQGIKIHGCVEPRRCSACRGTGRIDDAYCGCKLGRDLERVEMRAFREPVPGDA